MAKKRRKLDEEKSELDMSPMIDCVFLLLIFFIVVSAQAEVQIDPKVEPTIARDSIKQDSNVGRIVVNAYYEEGQITYTSESGDRIGTDDLGEYIKGEVKRIEGLEYADPRPLLHLRCDRALKWKDIQHVKDVAGNHKVNTFNFASYQDNPKK